jgi:HPt (histidine-containing phosphotransfer) domain-containing protein
MQTQVSGNNATQFLDVARGVGMMGSEAALRKILVTVLASMAADLPKIDSALQTGDVTTANRLLHALKGYMPILAVDALVNKVTAVEKLSKTADADEVKLQYQELSPELNGLLAEINVFLTAK